MPAIRILSRVLVVLIFVFIGFLSWWILSAKEKKLVRLTRHLTENPTDNAIREYIAMVGKMKIPSKEAMFWGHLREAYEAVLKSTADESTKQQFRSFLRDKGARWAR
ncbi:hypothetical protein [Alicyclobacillus sp. ALC3]|uniref:hypothetical protein n=1 Tax=Alicyclobacillus sp. ALC3 TaxID=2796143 RepID=UPI002379E16F|nr:hypothetical protein [Alicyclobacillus sp. ALC3]WDL95691.1 hypothetical protein JC200_15090 [Alicyclobacillus sp. ALC3]